MSGADQVTCPHGVPFSVVCPKCVITKKNIPLNGGRTLLPDMTPPNAQSKKGETRAQIGVVIGLCHVCGHAITAKVAVAVDTETGRPIQGARTDAHRRSPIIGAPMCEGSGQPVNVQFIAAAGTIDDPQTSKFDCTKCNDSKHVAILQRPPLQRGFRVLNCPECQDSPKDEEGTPTQCIHDVSLKENCDPCMEIVKRKVGNETAERLAESADN